MPTMAKWGLLPIDDEGEGTGTSEQWCLAVGWLEDSGKVVKSSLDIATSLLAIVAIVVVEDGLKSSASVRGVHLG